MTLDQKINRNIHRLNTSVILAEEANLPALRQRAEDFIHIAFRVKSLHETLIRNHM